MSVDPYMRGRMNDMKSYVPPFQLDAPLEGGAVGEVLESNVEGVEPGTRVLHQLGWRNGEPALFSPEYEACARIARQNSVPLREVYAQAQLAYQETNHRGTEDTEGTQRKDKKNGRGLVPCL